MSRTHRIAHYVQRITYVNFFRPEARDNRPADARPQTHGSNPHYAGWEATSFSEYAPFRASANG